MEEKYNPQRIETEWQDKWNRDRLFAANPEKTDNKYYCLTMYPYPSGVLHMGHVINYTLGDVITRYQILQNRNVLSPMGWDSFGLPAENAAIRTGIHPHTFTESNIAHMTDQMKRAGWGYDWNRELATSHEDYYKWTQWFFLKFYEKGLAVKKTAPVNWCESCKTVLANEQVHDGKCERCGTEVIQEDMSQWFFTMSKYAQRLLNGHKNLRGKWPDAVLAMQEEWIGRSDGASVMFKVKETGDELPIFTTRPDTLFGVTFMSLAPEHPLIEKLVTGTEHQEQVMKEVSRMRKQGTSEREMVDREKIGVWTGFHVVNPVNGESVPLWVANFALMTYGTGAVMAVPAHDQRDFEFARKYDIPIKVVIKPPEEQLNPDTMQEAYVEPGIMIDSGPFNGRLNTEAMADIIRWLEENNHGQGTVNYRLRDWLISRQRYWGAPIPIVYCDTCGMVPVPEADLPVRLPTDVEFKEGGGNPLATSQSFVECSCPTCSKKATRETDTMDTFVDSSWYFLRYCDPHNNDAAFDPVKVRNWMPVDQYIGGIEHATMHLIYARFFTMVLKDLGLIDFEEPFTRLFCQGMVCKTAYYCQTHKWLPEDKVEGEYKGDGIVNGICRECGKPVHTEMTKISKSKFNVVDPDEMFAQYGADTVRLYMLSDEPPDNMQIWSTSGINGSWRMLNRLWTLLIDNIESIPELDTMIPADLNDENRGLRRMAHQCIISVAEAIEGGFKFNTGIAQCNKLMNQLRSSKGPVEPTVLREVLETVIRVLSPIIPHFSEEAWSMMGHNTSIFRAGWPVVDPEIAKQEEVTLVVQVNGKIRDKLSVPASITEDKAREIALNSERIKSHLDNRQVVKVIYVPGKLVNIVVK